MTPRDAFLAARDFLLAHRTDYERARRDFRWPELTDFNWALDYFDPMALGNTTAALEFVRPPAAGGGLEAGAPGATSFDQLSRASSQFANALTDWGAKPGDRLLVMLPNVPILWTAFLGAIKCGVVLVPATPQLTPPDLADRFARGGVRHVLTDAAGAEKLEGMPVAGAKILSGGARPGWHSADRASDRSDRFVPARRTQATDPLLLYFTSGTTAKPKLVLHTHQSYPVGHLSTMYWLGVRPGDRHLNISSPGWAKHAWSSFFAPWNAGASVLVFDVARFDTPALLGTLGASRVTTFCAPPTVWRMVVNERLTDYRVDLREALSAGEPLNPEVIQRVADAWGVTIRDGYGQTETTALVGNSPGQPVKPGSMGRPLPGYRIGLRPVGAAPAPPETGPAEGEIAVGLDARPLGLMVGYLDDPGRMEASRGEGYYRTGDVAMRDEDGYITYVGRADDVFKSSDYRISPFELESVLIEHPGVAEAGVVESPDPVRLTVAKAFIMLRPGFSPGRDLALDILRFVRGRVAPYKRIRRLEFVELPKTISGKIRRVELRERERDLVAKSERPTLCFWEDDFPEL